MCQFKMTGSYYVTSLLIDHGVDIHAPDKVSEHIAARLIVMYPLMKSFKSFFRTAKYHSESRLKTLSSRKLDVMKLLLSHDIKLDESTITYLSEKAQEYPKYSGFLACTEH